MQNENNLQENEMLNPMQNLEGNGLNLQDVQIRPVNFHNEGTGYKCC